MLRVMEGETTEHDPVLEKQKGSLSGRVTDQDDGAPIPNVNIKPAGYLFGAMTDADGRYSIEDMDAGSYLVEVTPPMLYSATNFTVTIKAGMNMVKDLKLRAKTTIIMVVKDADGNPLEGATVTAGQTYSTTTDADGNAVLEVLPGPYVIKVQAEGYKTAIMDDNLQKGDLKAYQVTMVKPTTGGTGGNLPVAVIGGAVGVAVLVVVILAVVMMRRKKAGAAAGAPGAPGAAAGAGGPAAPGERTEADKKKEWAEFERMYGRPHPDAPGWVSAGAAAAAGPKPKCPKDGTAVSFEPFSGKYFCSKCDERYAAEEVFKREDELLELSRPTTVVAGPQGEEEPQRRLGGEKLELSTAQPTWALERGESVHAPGEMPPPPPSPPAGGEPPAAAPMEAAPVSDDEPVPEAVPATAPEGVNPEAGLLFNMPKPVDHSELPPPAPPKEPPRTDG